MRKIIRRMIEHGEQAGQMAARDAAVNRSDRAFVAALLTLGALQPNASSPNWLGWSG